MTTTGTDLLATHRERLDDALTAIHGRGYYSAFPESPSPRVYGETAAADGKSAFEAHLGTTYAVETPGSAARSSPSSRRTGSRMDVSYPRTVEDGLDELLAAAQQGIADWRRAGIDARDRGHAWRSSTGCTSGSSSWPTRSSTPAVKRS